MLDFLIKYFVNVMVTVCSPVFVQKKNYLPIFVGRSTGKIPKIIETFQL